MSIFKIQGDKAPLPSDAHAYILETDFISCNKYTYWYWKQKIWEGKKLLFNFFQYFLFFALKMTK